MEGVVGLAEAGDLLARQHAVHHVEEDLHRGVEVAEDRGAQVGVLVAVHEEDEGRERERLPEVGDDRRIEIGGGGAPGIGDRLHLVVVVGQEQAVDEQDDLADDAAAEEDDEALGFLGMLRRHIGGGNILIYPTTTGANGFKHSPASAEICSFLKTFIDPEPLTGYGAGVAPVGHRVSVQQRNVDSFALHVVVTLKEGSELTPENVASARHSLEGYFEELRAALVSQKGDTFPNDPGSIAGYRTVLYKQRVLEAVRIGGNFEAATNVYRVSGTGYEFELPEEYIIDLSYSPQSGGLPVLADSFEITTGGMG